VLPRPVVATSARADVVTASVTIAETPILAGPAAPLAAVVLRLPAAKKAAVAAAVIRIAAAVRVTAIPAATVAVAGDGT